MMFGRRKRLPHFARQMRDRTRARQLAAEYLAKGDPTGWFEQMYREGEEGQSIVPWMELRPNPNLLDFWKDRHFPTAGQTALKIGCGFGDDAEQLAEWGFRTTAFDISETAIRGCRRRFPESRVQYVKADLLNPPAEWARAFHFVLECYTLQALPPDVRARAMECVAGFVAQGGKLLVIARARDEADPHGEMPWPLSQKELRHFTEIGLRELSLEDYMDSEDPPVRRFRVLYANGVE
jgi:SAM-dependent methyltransferase